MRALFDKHIKPLIKDNMNVIEIGSEYGEVTKKLKLMNLKSLITIDPVCNYKSETFFTFYKNISLNILPTLENKSIDIFLVDGDHNWYTIYNELIIIKDKIKDDGLIFCHDVVGTWSKRDMYYNIEIIPIEFRQHTFNKFGHISSNIEGGIRNGVLSAIMDFINENKEFCFEIVKEAIECSGGLGIIRRNEYV